MKRFFTFFLSLGMIFSLACTPEEQAEPVFKTTTPGVLQFTAEGGQGEITYTLENPASGLEITYTCEADWITDITIGQSVTFTVAPNDSHNERSERFTLSYGDDTNFVKIVQKGKKIEADQKQTMVDHYCTYYNKDIFVEQETNRYLLGLCDMPFGEEDEDLVASGANYYRFNLCADVYAEKNNNKIPNGTYVIDHKYNYINGTIEDLNTFGFNADDSYLRIKEATVVVSNNHIEAIIVVGNSQMPDEVRHLVYDGPTTITDIGTIRIGNLMTGVNVDMNQEIAPYCFTQSVFYSEAWDTNENLHQMMVIEDYMSTNGNYFLLNLINSKDNPFGTYTPLEKDSNSVEYTFVPGSLDSEGYLAGSWFATLTNGQVTSVDFMAPLQTGTITVSQDGSNCIITIDCYDEVGNHITANINTPFQQVNSDQYGAPASLVNVPLKIKLNNK